MTLWELAEKWKRSAMNDWKENSASQVMLINCAGELEQWARELSIDEKKRMGRQELRPSDTSEAIIYEIRIKLQQLGVPPEELK